MVDTDDGAETVTAGSPQWKSSFPETRWSLIVAAKGEATTQITRALEELCSLYWQPVYGYIRRRGWSPEDAEDLTQGFFAAFLRREEFATADKDKGKLRSYILTCVTHFLSDEYDRRTALKRGGGQVPLSIDQAAAEENYQLEPRENVAPDLLFEKRWATTLLEDVLNRLRQEYERKGKLEVFDKLRPCLAWNAREAPVSEVAESLSMSENAVRISVFRLRRRYGDALRQTILETVVDPAEVDAEIDHLFAVISKTG